MIPGCLIVRGIQEHQMSNWNRWHFKCKIPFLTFCDSMNLSDKADPSICRRLQV